MFVAFCGIDGSGKSTHIVETTKWLKQMNKPVEAFKPIQPKSSFVHAYKQISDQYKNLYNKPLGKYGTILFGFELFRANQIVKEFIKKEKIVLVDRWVYSHYAYAYAHDIQSNLLDVILDACLEPDIVIPVVQSLKTRANGFSLLISVLVVV